MKDPMLQTGSLHIEVDVKDLYLMQSIPKYEGKFFKSITYTPIKIN